MSDKTAYWIQSHHNNTSDTLKMMVTPFKGDLDWVDLFLRDDTLSMNYDEMIRHTWHIYFQEEITEDYLITQISKDPQNSKTIWVEDRNGKCLVITARNGKIGFLSFFNKIEQKERERIINSYRPLNP